MRALTSLASSTWPRRTARVRRRYEHGVGIVRHDLVVVSERRMDDFRPFTVAFEQVRTNLRMPAFHFMVSRFADIVQ